MALYQSSVLKQHLILQEKASRTQISQTDKQIFAMVNELYRSTQKEIEIVENS